MGDKVVRTEAAKASRPARDHRRFAVLLSMAVACTEPHIGESVGEAGATERCQLTACDGGAQALRDGAADPGPSVLTGERDAAALHEAGPASEERDAAASLPAAGDAATAGADSPRSLLLGKYALRVRFYGKDVATGTQFLSQEITWLADITEGEGDSLRLSAETCEDHGEGTGSVIGPKISAILQYPELAPIREFEIVLENGGFRAFGEYLIGYTAEPPANCQPGQTRTGPSGPCVCPSSVLPPTRANDCRVYDSDMDGNPGYSVVLTGGISRTDYVRHKDMSQIVMGKISAEKKHTAIYEYSHDHFTLECGRPTCPVSEFEPCLVEESHALFYPLPATTPTGGAWSCPEIMRRSAAFFPTTPLARSCP